MQLSAGRMQLLIDDLLAFSRITTTELVFELTDLQAIIEEIKAELTETIADKKATIITHGLVPINIIAFQFRQLMYNLISNALKFSKKGVPLVLDIQSGQYTGEELYATNPTLLLENLQPATIYNQITIEDNGIGFEPYFNERIFGVFQKLHGKEMYEGTGIGLAIVKKIVENHKGIIKATGQLGQGARFDIYIPQ